MEQSNKYALITGATSGIGLELAKLFAADHYNLILVARSEQELLSTAATLESYGINTITVAKDLFNKEAPFELYDIIKAKGIQIDVLVNDAGQGIYGEFKDTDLKRELDVIQLNICAVVVLTKLFLKDMISNRNGKILNLASVAGKIPGPFQAVYHGTKAFIHSFNEAIRSELKGSGITVTSLLPGATDTDFFHKADMEASKIVQDGELADPAVVAKDGYDALMAGKDMAISGLMNKMQVGMSHVLPDSIVADRMKKEQAPKEEK